MSKAFKSDVRECVQQLARFGFMRANTTSGEEDCLEKIVEEGEFTAEDEEQQDLGQACQEIIESTEGGKDNWFAKVFETNTGRKATERSGREMRLALQVALGSAMSSEPIWMSGTQAYLSLVSLPGALSYQMFVPSLFRLCINRIADACKDPSPKEKQPSHKLLRQLGGVVADVGSLAGRLEDCGLLELWVQTLVSGGAGARGEDQDFIKSCLFRMISYSGKEQHGDPQVDAENDCGEESSEGSDEEISESRENRKMKSAIRRARKSTGYTSSTGETLVLKVLLARFKSERKGLEWSAKLTRNLLEANAQGSQVDGERSDLHYSPTCLRLLEHMCFDVPDKVDERKTAVDAVLVVAEECISCGHSDLAVGTLYRFCQFLSKLAHSRDASQRGLAAQVAGALLLSTSHVLDEDMIQGLLEIVVSRADDRSPMVRSTALKSVGALIGSPQLSKLGDNAGEENAIARAFILSSLRTLRRRVADSKPAVRRYAVLAMQQLLCSPLSLAVRGREPLITEDLAALCDRSRDTSPLIRCATVQTSSRMLAEYSSDERVQSLWTETVLPLVFDQDVSVQKAVKDAVKVAVFDSVLEWHDQSKLRVKKNHPEQASPVWSLVANLDGSQGAPCLRKAFVELARKDDKGGAGVLAVRPVVKALQVALKTAGSSGDLTMALGAWVLFDLMLSSQEKEVLSQAVSALDVESLVESWDSSFSEADEGCDSKVLGQIKVRVLSVLVSACGRVDPQEARRISSVLLEELSELRADSEILRRSLQLLVALCKSKAPTPREGEEMIARWGEALQARCESILSKCSETQASEPLACNALFLVGELAILGLDPDDKSKALVPLSPKLVTLTMGILARGGDEQGEQGQEQNQQMRAHALVATGKICLRDERTAKQVATSLVRELDSCRESEVVRSNAVVILGDLLRRYTSLIDPHLDTLCAAMADPSPVVRRNALILLTGLLQEDYIKWRGTLFVRIVVCCVDPDREIREMSRYAIKSIFPEKSPGLYQSQFVELAHALNNVSTAKYQVARQLEPHDVSGSKLGAERRRYLGRLTGDTPQARALRSEIYRLLLESMSDTNRLEVTNKICREVLGAVLDGHLELPDLIKTKESAHGAVPEDQLVQDWLEVLCSPEIRVRTRAAPNGVEVCADDDAVQAAAAEAPSSAAAAKLAAAKSRVLLKLEKKNLTENVIPLAISLYRFLQRARSRHVSGISRYLQVLFSESREEMDTVIGADKLLAQEIEYDIAQLSKQREAKREQLGSRSATANRSMRRVSVLFQDQEETLGAEQLGEDENDSRKESESNKRSLEPTTAEKKVASKRRRVSGVTFLPDAKDTAPRHSASGVLKTPIPTRTKQQRGPIATVQDLMATLQGNQTPRLAQPHSVSKSSSKVKRLSLTLGSCGTPLSIHKKASESSESSTPEPSLLKIAR